MPKDKPDSKVIQFVCLAWNNAGGDPRSWQEYNQQVREVVHIAAAGFNWVVGDLDKLVAITNYRYSIDKCLGDGGREWLYSIGVKSANMSLCVEYERFTGRAPIIVDDVNGRQRDRLCIGSEFQWNDEKVKVTSFNADGKAVACSYKQVGEHKACQKCHNTTSWPTEKIHKRYVIGPEDVKAERAVRKRLQTALDAVYEIAERSESDRLKIRKALGSKNKEQFNALPVEALEAAVAKFPKKAKGDASEDREEPS